MELRAAARRELCPALRAGGRLVRLAQAGHGRGRPWRHRASPQGRLGPGAERNGATDRGPTGGCVRLRGGPRDELSLRNAASSRHLTAPHAAGYEMAEPNRRVPVSFNTFGHLFRVTTFGESHGPTIGCVIDGCPPRIPLTEADIQPYLDRRRPGQSRFTTQRREPDQVKILSGVFIDEATGKQVT